KLTLGGVGAATVGERSHTSRINPDGLIIVLYRAVVLVLAVVSITAPNQSLDIVWLDLEGRTEERRRGIGLALLGVSVPTIGERDGFLCSGLDSVIEVLDRSINRSLGDIGAATVGERSSHTSRINPDGLIIVLYRAVVLVLDVENIAAPNQSLDIVWLDLEG